MADAAFKPERDYSKEADKQIPEAEQLAKVGGKPKPPCCAGTRVNIQSDRHPCRHREACRSREADAPGKPHLPPPPRRHTPPHLTSIAPQASDLASTSRILISIVTICRNAGDWSLLSDQTLVLSKKHGQLKQAITKMVQTVMGFLDKTPSLETKLSVIETLRTVTEGKIFVEVERARVTKILSDIKKQQGDLKGATETLCELQVETFGSMDRREKTEFILAQVELCIENGDWTQAGILSRKISTRYLARKPKKTPEQLEKEKKEREKKGKVEEEPEPEDDTTDLKLRYYRQQIQLAQHDAKYLDVCKHYRQVLDTESIEENPKQLRMVCTRAPRPSEPVTNFPTGTAAHHLFHHPRAPRQRAARSPPQDPQRLAHLDGARRCRAPEALHSPRAHAVARGLPRVRAPPDQHRRL